MPSITDSKCILIIGATSGIGRAMALSFLELPAAPTIIVGGRRQERLDELITKSDKIKAVRIDIDTDSASLKKFVDDMTTAYPNLDTVVLCAGIQNGFDFTRPETVDFSRFQSEINTNYVAIATLMTQFLPHLLKLGAGGQPCFLIPVSSGLALAPIAGVPNYCASKAALHSFSTSLGIQLHGTNVHVMEIIPPLVESELHGDRGTTESLSGFGMSLKEYTKEQLDGLKRGGLHVPVGSAVTRYTRFKESERLEFAQKMYNL